MLLDDPGPAERPARPPQSERANHLSQTDRCDRSTSPRNHSADANTPAQESADREHSEQPLDDEDGAEAHGGCEENCAKIPVPGKEVVVANPIGTTADADNRPVDPAATVNPNPADGNVVNAAPDAVPVAMPKEAEITDDAMEAKAMAAPHGTLHRPAAQAQGKVEQAQDAKLKDDAGCEAPRGPAVEAGNAHGKDQKAPHNHLIGRDPATKPAIELPPQVLGETVGAPKTGAETVQTLATWSPATSSATGPAGAAANVPAPAQAVAVPMAGLAVTIAIQAQAGRHRFEIRLDPPELGRIDVRLDIDRDGHVTSRLVVDRAETLDLLKRDAAQLERALQQAGLKTSDNALEFSLRQQAFERDETDPQGVAELIVSDDEATAAEAMRPGYGQLLGLGSGLDIRV